VQRLEDSVEAARRVERNLRDQTEQLIASARRVSEKVLLTQRQLDHLTKAVVSMRRLLEAHDERDAVASVREILVNVIGTEHFVVYGAGTNGRSWVPLVGMGRSFDTAMAAGSAPSYVIEWLVARGSARDRADGGAIWDRGVVACVPLTLLDGLYGAIVIHQLLPHRAPLDMDDEELLMLLGRIAPTAMLAARHRLTWRREHAMDRTGLR
jgi:hypothetical protein